jgi:hypothetical protein
MRRRHERQWYGQQEYKSESAQDAHNPYLLAAPLSVVLTPGGRCSFGPHPGCLQAYL